MLGNRCLCDCYGNWPSWGGAGRGRGARGPLRDCSGPRRGVRVGAGLRGGLGDPGRSSLMPAETLLRQVLFLGPLAAPARSVGRGVEGSVTKPPEQVPRLGSASTRVDQGRPGGAWPPGGAGGTRRCAPSSAGVLGSSRGHVPCIAPSSTSSLCLWTGQGVPKPCSGPWHLPEGFTCSWGSMSSTQTPVLGWRGAKWTERKGRSILKALGLHPGVCG